MMRFAAPAFEKALSRSSGRRAAFAFALSDPFGKLTEQTGCIWDRLDVLPQAKRDAAGAGGTCRPYRALSEKRGSEEAS